MTEYLLLKWLHILSSVLMVGTGFGSAFYFFFILRTRNVQAIAQVARLVVRADWWFTTPAVILQPLTGYAMMRLAGFDFEQLWLTVSLGLYALAGVCWLPVVWLQIRMSHDAHQAATANTELSERFWRNTRIWTALGIPAFVAMLLVYGLMVFKPV